MWGQCQYSTGDSTIWKPEASEHAARFEIDRMHGLRLMVRTKNEPEIEEGQASDVVEVEYVVQI